MCGIHLQVYCLDHEDYDDENDTSSDVATTTSRTKTQQQQQPEEWLLRRGPDHSGCYSYYCTVNNNNNSSIGSSTEMEMLDETTGTTTATTTAEGGGGESGGGEVPDDEGQQLMERTTTTATTRRRRRQKRKIINVVLQCSVLQMRQELVRQPVQLSVVNDTIINKHAITGDGDDDDECHSHSTNYCNLAWNGEVYQRRGRSKSSTTTTTTSEELQDIWHFDQPDTRYVAQILEEALSSSFCCQSNEKEGGRDNNNNDNNNNDTARIMKAIANSISLLVDAEFAFCVTTPYAVYYGRDSFGRRSLLTYDNDNDKDKDDRSTTSTSSGSERCCSGCRPCWLLSSVASYNSKNGDDNNNACSMNGWKEVVPGRVHCYNLFTGEISSIPYTTVDSSPPPPQLGLPSTQQPSSMMEASYHLEILLLEAVRRRMMMVGREGRGGGVRGGGGRTGVSVLFSGGVDSVVVAALALKLLDPKSDPPITLINVSFVDEHSSKDSNDSGRGGEEVSEDAKQAAAAAAAVVPAAADTQTARASYCELKTIFPNHQIRFLQKQIDWKEISAVEQHIRNLIYPKTSTMDLNIASALWFAASPTSAAAVAAADRHDEPRILLTGLGADELMGGYGRHRKAWEEGGNEKLRKELELDRNRLWERNLGRDDRVLSDTSKEARFPFLDAYVVNYLSQPDLPLQYVSDYTLPPGEGDKRILRLIAQRMGLDTASQAVKRAIQFGSRISHVSDKRRFGSRRKATSQANVQ